MLRSMIGVAHLANVLDPVSVAINLGQTLVLVCLCEQSVGAIWMLNERIAEGNWQDHI